MKAILTFDTSEDDFDLIAAIKGVSSAVALWQIVEYLRKELKYNCTSDAEYEALEKRRDAVLAIIDQLGLMDLITNQ